VHVHFTALFSRLANELDGIVEDASDVFSYMVLQMVRLIFDSFVDQVVFTVVGCAVDDVSYANLTKHLFVFGH
jgi:hypothetical protein